MKSIITYNKALCILILYISFISVSARTIVDNHSDEINLNSFISMTIAIFGLNDLYTNCPYMGGNDTVKAFYSDENGILQESGYGVKFAGHVFIQFQVFGDDPQTPNKDGFIIGDKIILKLYRGGKIFELVYMNGYGQHQIYFNPNMQDFIQAQDAIGYSELSLSGNNHIINHNETIPSIEKGTDFGINSIPVTKVFKIKNTGCDNLILTHVDLNNNANFHVRNISKSHVYPGDEALIEITYNAIQDAQSTVSIYNNSTINPFVFNISGSYLLNWSIYPNPVGSSEDGTNVTFEVTGTQKFVSILLYDRFGNLIRTSLAPTLFNIGTHTYYLNTYDLASGMYNVKLIISNNESIKQLIKY